MTSCVLLLFRIRVGFARSVFITQSIGHAVVVVVPVAVAVDHKQWMPEQIRHATLPMQCNADPNFKRYFNVFPTSSNLQRALLIWIRSVHHLELA